MRIPTLAILWIYSAATLAQIPDNIIDFDRSVGFSVPRNITVYPAVNAKDVVFLVPNGLILAQGNNNSPTIGMVYRGMGHGGQLIIKITPTIDGVPIEEIVSDLRTQFPNLHFAYPGVKDSSFEITGPGFNPLSLTRTNAGDPLAGGFVYAVQLPEIAVRALLTPQSYLLAILAVSAEFHVRGVARDASGKPTVEDRVFRVSTALDGFCALSPAATMNMLNGRSGCIHPRYDPGMVRQIQRALIAHGEAPGPADGKFGPNTERAIRSFQRDNRLPVDGIPTSELLAFMQPESAAADKTER